MSKRKDMRSEPNGSLRRRAVYTYTPTHTNNNNNIQQHKLRGKESEMNPAEEKAAPRWYIFDYLSTFET